VKGAVPGTEGTYVKLRDAVKSRAPDGVPMPGAYRKNGEQPAAKEETPVEAAVEETVVAAEEPAVTEAPAAVEAAAPEAPAADVEAPAAEEAPKSEGDEA
jgi:large subunit ribosomal protein L3